jgi:hypothetical protein
MPITVELKENGHILYAVFKAPYDLAEAVAGRDKEEALRDASDHTIHSLLILSDSKRPPANILRVASRGTSFSHRTRGKIAIVGGSPIARTIVQMAAKVARGRFENIRFFDREEDAWKYLRSVIAQEQATKTAAS